MNMNMMPYGHCSQSRVSPVVCPPVYRCNELFSQREVPYIHPIVNVNRMNVVEVPRHYYTETTRNVMGDTFRQGMGPQVGGIGTGPGRGPGFGPGYGPGFGPQVGGVGTGMGPGFGPGFGPGYGSGCCSKRRWCR